jgi:hypothetical protein
MPIFTWSIHFRPLLIPLDLENDFVSFEGTPVIRIRSPVRRPD